MLASKMSNLSYDDDDASCTALAVIRVDGFHVSMRRVVDMVLFTEIVTILLLTLLRMPPSAARNELNRVVLVLYTHLHRRPRR